MAKVEYTEQQKADAVKRAQEIGVQKAAKELGIPWQPLSKWNKEAGNPTFRGTQAEKKAAKEKAASAKKTAPKKSASKSKATKKTSAKASIAAASKKAPAKTAGKTAKAQAKSKAAKASASKKAESKAKAAPKPTALEIRNAVLKEENQALKAQIAKLKKALSNLL